MLVGERVDLKAWAAIDTLANNPLTVEVKGPGVATLNRYGVVVFFDVLPVEEWNWTGRATFRTKQGTAEKDWLHASGQQQARVTRVIVYCGVDRARNSSDPVPAFLASAPGTPNVFAMAIWKLAPIATSAYDDAWAFTCWYGSTLVRARNPGQARKIAAAALRKAQAGESDTERTSLMSPWLDDGLVVCSRVPVSTYRPDGPDQILQPHLMEYRQS